MGRKKRQKSPPRARCGHLEGDVGRLRNSFRWQIGVRAKGFRGRKGALGQTSVQVPAPMFGLCDLTKSYDLSESWVPYLQCGEGP